MALPRIILNQKFGGVVGEIDAPGPDEAAAFLESATGEDGHESVWRRGLKGTSLRTFGQLFEALGSSAAEPEGRAAHVDHWNALISARIDDPDLAEAVRELGRPDYWPIVAPLPLAGSDLRNAGIVNALAVAPGQAAEIGAAVERIVTSEGGLVDDSPGALG